MRMKIRNHRCALVGYILLCSFTPCSSFFASSVTLKLNRKIRQPARINGKSRCHQLDATSQNAEGAKENASRTNGPRKGPPSTTRSVAIFALKEGGEKHPMFSIRRLENDPSYLDMDSRDRAFARMLLTTTERRQGQIDKVLKQFIKSSNRFRKSRDSDMLCQAVLRIGAAQLLFMDIPVYAAVKETVDVLRMDKRIHIPEAKVKFVNAVLRNIEREGVAALKKTSINDNIQPWLVKEWKNAYGSKRTKLIAEASMSEPVIFLSVNYHGETGDAKQQYIQRVVDEFSTEDAPAIPLPHGSVRIPKEVVGSVTKWPRYNEGAWWVQDASATLPAIALYNALKEENVNDLHVVDLCSAPGGKTAQLCSFGFEKVTAIEINARRVNTLEENMSRLGMEDTVEVLVADGTEWTAESESDRPRGVLVDAPCSATGLGSRRPDVLKKEMDLDELLDVQRKLAEHTIDDVLGPGGVMVYATCSLLKQESEDQMKLLMKRETGPTIETVPFTPGEIPGFDDAIDENGWLRVLPGILPGSLQKCDGFFVARIRRVD